jgi:hypothetical protein
LASVFVVNLEFYSKDGIDCCHQRDAAHSYNDTCRPSTCSAAIWCRDIWRQGTWRGRCFMPVCLLSFVPNVLADGCEPEFPLRIIFGRNFCSAS